MKKLLIILSVVAVAAATQLPTTVQAAQTNKNEKAAPVQYPPANGKISFAYLQQYLKNPQVVGSKKVDLTNSVIQLKRAEQYKANKREDRAKELLAKTTERVSELASEGKIQPLYATRYLQAVDSLIKSWSAPVRVNGGYPDKWHNAPISSLIDDWGFYNRQAPSYVAFRIAESGRYMPRYTMGDSKQWPDKARALGIPVDTTPRVGDAMISTAGTYGHAMYVEEILPNDMIRVSQYNAIYDGLYSEAVVSATARNAQYIHFPYN